MKHKLLLSLTGLLGTGIAMAGNEPDWIAPYNVVWTTPSSKALDSMPIGGGTVALNVWTADRELLLQNGAAGAGDERKIYLLPAWPKEWDVDFKLHAPYATTVEGRFRRGKIEQRVVTPLARAADVVDMSRAADGR